MKKRFTVGQFFRLAKLLMSAINAAMEEARAARGPMTPGGEKITPDEAADITVSALSRIADDLESLLVG